MSDDYPFTGTTAEMDYEEDLPVFTELAYDFQKHDFIYTEKSHQHVIVTEDEALKVWVYKALLTERYRYLAYSWQYGLEVRPFIGKVMSVQERYSELRRIIIECLMVNPYIKSVDSIEFTPDKDQLTVEVHLTTIYGEVDISV